MPETLPGAALTWVSAIGYDLWSAALTRAGDVSQHLQWAA